MTREIETVDQNKMGNQGYQLMKDKVAMVTGASSGIGAATAFEFAKNGVKVALCDVQEEAGRAMASTIERETGVPAVFVKCDVSRMSDVERAVGTILERFGRIDYAFNNAGIEGTPSPTADSTEENWDRTIAINLKGVFNCMKQQIPHMLKRGGGSIVNCSSIAGLVGFSSMPAYVASKHGVVGLTKSAALDYARTGIRVNAVCPGVIATPMVERFTGGNRDAKAGLVDSEPIGRMGRPQEIADAVLWLCSSRASFVTGQAIAIDGGWVAK